MEAVYPLVFEPRMKERIWGGRTLETLYGKALAPDLPIGESWEVSDRPGDESVIVNGPWAGQTLRWAMTHHADALLGASAPAPGGRFPLLCKILDARERLSLQVHPPPHASHLGDPKTEMWYIARADPGAELYVGLRRGVTRAEFEQRLEDGSVADCFHRIQVRAGDTMFLPSGRVHAIGAGLVIFEIQQNSDTTFRVFDWNRRDRHGNLRELHVPQSLASIDFDDIEPSLAGEAAAASGPFSIQPLVRHSLFDTDLVRAAGPGAMPPSRRQRVSVIAVTEGTVRVSGGGEARDLAAGQFCVMPAMAPDASVHADTGAAFLVTEAGS